MQIKTTYKGYINGVFGIFCGFKPVELDVTEEIPVYYPDENKVFEKDNKTYTSVILQDGESIDEYKETEKTEEVE